MTTAETGSSVRQDEWRACEPEVRNVVERVMPRAFAMADERRQINLPAPGKEFVDQMAAEVRDKVANPERGYPK